MTFAVLFALLLLFAGCVTRHAWALTHYVADAPTPKQPWDMSWSEKAHAALFGVRIPKPPIRATPADYGMADFETITIPRAPYELSVWHVPADDAVGTAVLFHGYNRSKDHMLPHAAALHSRGWDVYLPDFYGSGDSSGMSTTIGYDEACDVRAVADAVRARVGPDQTMVLIGHSMGAASILRGVAHEGVQADALVVEGCFGDMLETAKSRFTKSGAPAFPLAHILTFWGGALNGFWAFGHNPIEYAESVTIPTFVLVNEGDDRAPPADAYAIRDAIHGEVFFHEFPVEGHDSVGEHDAEAWAEVVAPFVQEMAARHAPLKS